MQTIDNAIYDRIPNDWWSDDSFMALLRNAVNPPRFEYFNEVLLRRFGRVPHQLSVLDVGCGGGPLAERFAAIGCTVTGVDRSIPTLMAARKHARAAGLSFGEMGHALVLTRSRELSLSYMGFAARSHPQA